MQVEENKPAPENTLSNHGCVTVFFLILICLASFVWSWLAFLIFVPDNMGSVASLLVALNFVVAPLVSLFFYRSGKEIGRVKSVVGKVALVLFFGALVSVIAGSISYAILNAL